MRILNFGSLNLDNVYRVPHILLPGETLTASSMETFCGGKGSNQSLALARAGAEVWHAGCIGPDGEPLRRIQQEAGVHTDFLRTVERPTGSTVIQVADNAENNIIYYPGANHAITDAHVAEATAAFGPGDLLLCQNEVAGVERILRAGAARGMTVCFNPSPITSEVADLPLELVNVFLVNELEAAALAGPGDDPAGRLAARYPGAEVVMTLGSRGVCRVKGGERITVPSFPVQAVDTTGAGDTFTGFYLCGRAAGLPPETALRRACAAAALAVSRMGAAVSIPTAPEVDAFLRINV